jgi:diguanylate cyclase (GGDEF)-like protein
MTATGQRWISRDPRLSVAAARFWRILSLAMFTYTAGMIGDLVSLAIKHRPGFSVAEAGETLLYPVGALFTVVALVVFPTTAQSRMERIKIGLDVAIVLFGSATFVWYFVASPRWHPSDGWQKLSSGLVLPALSLVAGFAILRIAMAGANVISRSTMSCFIFAAASEAAAIVLDKPAGTPVGRLGLTLQTLGLTACVVGIAIQARSDPMRSTAPAKWRRPFTVLPYGALTATVVLLLIVIGTDLDYRGSVVALGVLTVCAAVIARQLASLRENSRLLSANRQLTVRLQHQAFHDQLTALVNRTLFTERVGQALDRARGGHQSVAVLFIDLDDFKIVNDSLGHQAGDELLIAVAARLHSTLRAQDTLGRLGGDEFAILVEDGSPTAPTAVAQRVITALSSPFRMSDAQVTVEASVGVAIASGNEADPAELLRNADVAMYAAKHLQKGGWRVFEPAMLVALRHRHQLRAALLRAVDRDEFDVYHQPIVDLVDGTVHGTEALVRWRRDGSLVPPGEFIPLAEETGLIAEIDQRVLFRACHQAVQWQTPLPGGGPFALHVNLSARQLHRPDLVTDVARALHASGLAAGRLTLEITESGLGNDHEAAIQRLDGLARLGVHLAIDDFGTGYSSLAYLRRMPVDLIKIDKVFTDELLCEAVTAPLAQAVIVLATTLGMETVAEGIEHPMQASRLLELGCRYGQGFHFGEPLPADEMRELLVSAAPEHLLNAKVIG